MSAEAILIVIILKKYVTILPAPARLPAGMKRLKSSLARNAILPGRFAMAFALRARMGHVQRCIMCIAMTTAHAQIPLRHPALYNTTTFINSNYLVVSI